MWPVPTTGDWSAAIPPVPNANMGNYTPDQWASMQQQNWQQWTQWQQQYAQWQNQYGEKYTQQMQAMGMMPPLPAATTCYPPAPPPPDQPPPPPPHENNQPLFGSSNQAIQPKPVPDPYQPSGMNTNLQNAPTQQSNYQPPNIQLTMGNQQGYMNMPPPAVNNFVPQNIAPYGQNNAPHMQSQIPTMASKYAGPPPRTGLETTSQSSNLVDVMAKPPPFNKNQPPQSGINTEALKKLAEEEKLFDIQFQKWEEQIQQWKKENANHPDKQAYNEYEMKFEKCRAELLERRQQMKLKRAKLLESNNPPPNNAVDKVMQPPASVSATKPPSLMDIRTSHPMQQQNVNRPTYNYPKENNAPGNYNENMPPEKACNNNMNKNFIAHNKNESYQNADASKFLGAPTLKSTDGIPGLDLVPKTDKPPIKPPENVIDITGQPKPAGQDPAKLQPDYSTISKGINNILGDEKIMNILSMVRGDNNSQNNVTNNQPRQVQNIHQMDPYRNANNFNTQQNQFNNSFNQQYGNGPNMPLSQNIPGQHPQYGKSPKMPLLQNIPNQNQSHIQGSSNDMQSETPRVPPPENNYRDQVMNSRLAPNVSPHLRPNLVPNSNFSQRPNDYPVDTDVNNKMLGNNVPTINQPVRPKWVDEPLFAPSVIVEYEHKSLRVKAREFIEPVHTFDYNHKSKDNDSSKQNFEKEVEDLFTRKARKPEPDYDVGHKRYSREPYLEDTRKPRDLRDLRDEMYYKSDRHVDDRHNARDRYDDRRRDIERSSRRDDYHRDDSYDRRSYHKRDDSRHRSRTRSKSREKDLRKRARSKESDSSNAAKKSKENKFGVMDGKKQIVMIDDLLELPGRELRPPKIVIILRGPPGSGKSYLAKLIRDKEAEFGSTVRIMSIDDYFMQESEIEERDPVTGKMIKKSSLKYEYDEKQEHSYTESLKRAFKRTLTDGYFSFLIYDAVNEHLKCYADIWNFAKQNHFQVYTCTMMQDAMTCFKRNIHNRTLEDIQVICTRFFDPPAHHIQLDPTTLLQSAAITDVHMEDVSDSIEPEEVQNVEVESSFTSKWEKMDDADQLARLDGISKPLRPSQLSMEDYLQLDEWKPNVAKPGKKTVRWADIEERRQQEKMRAIGFVVGQTDWNRMTDPTMGSSALTQTKYIERVRRM